MCTSCDWVAVIAQVMSAFGAVAVAIVAWRTAQDARRSANAAQQAAAETRNATQAQLLYGVLNTYA
jgi:hypothetical protein